MRHYLIIGTGVAGISAAEAIREHDSQADICVIGDDPHGYYSRPGLAYLLSDEIPEQFLFPYGKHEFHQKKFTHRHALVTHIHPVEHQIELKDGSHLPYDRLLIATGSQAGRLSVPGADLEGVVKLDHLDDARHIQKLAARARSAVVVGGGITALELVEGLVTRGVHTHYLLRSSRYWSNVLDETESHLVEEKLVKDGVELHFETELAEITGNKGRVTGVRTKDQRTIACQMVAAAIGVHPRKELAEAAGIQTNRGILVDEYLHTNIQDVYAAGDVAQVLDPLSGQYHIDSLWGIARDQGYAAGLNMCDLAVPYQTKPAFNVTRLAGMTTTIIGMVGGGQDEDLVGIARGDSEIWRTMPDAIAVHEQEQVNRLRILSGRNTLLGAVVMGDQTLSEPLQNLIVSQADITALQPKLYEPGAPVGNLILDFWKQWEGEHAAG